MKELRGKHVVFIVENLSVPFDRRVWREANALKEAGSNVSVICPKGLKQDTKSYEIINDIEIYRYSIPLTQSLAVGYLWEYFKAFWATFFILLKINLKQKVNAIHVANPLEIFFPLGWLGKILNYKFIFDHHDLSPESFIYKYNVSKDSIIVKIILLMERLTVHTSDFIFSTNDSLRKIVIERDQADPSKVTIVRNGPDKSFLPVKSNPLLKKGKDFLLSYIGVMGIMDGVENIIYAIEYLVKEEDYNNFHTILIGYGDEYNNHKKLIKNLRLESFIEMPGRLSDDDVKEILSTCDICLAPDPRNGLNEYHTMNKIMDYMRMEKPIVSFDLDETKFSAGEAALYVENNDVIGFANAIRSLLNDDKLRKKLGLIGKERVEKKLTWEHSKKNLLKEYQRILSEEK